VTSVPLGACIGLRFHVRRSLSGAAPSERDTCFRILSVGWTPLGHPSWNRKSRANVLRMSPDVAGSERGLHGVSSQAILGSSWRAGVRIALCARGPRRVTRRCSGIASVSEGRRAGARKCSTPACHEAVQVFAQRSAPRPRVTSRFSMPFQPRRARCLHSAWRPRATRRF